MVGMEKDTKNVVDVSVIVPMYNVENLIAETIESLKKNECNFEVILVNDGSTDNTLQNAKACIVGDSRFRVLDQKNQGVSVARNSGIKNSVGEFIMFMDSDDILKDFAIDMLLAAAIEQQADYVYGGIKKFNKDKEWSIAIHDKSNLFSKGIKNISHNPELFFSMGPVAKLISRELIGDIYFPEEISCAEDQVFIFNIFINAQKIYSLGEYIYFYRERDIEENSASITQQRDEKAYQYFTDIITVLKIIKDINENSNFSINEKKNNLVKYYERAITYDVWPLFMRTLKYHPHHVCEAFATLQYFMRELDNECINNLPAVRYFFIRVLSDNIFYIRGYKDFIAYRKFLFFLFDCFNEGVFRYFSKPNSYGRRWDDSLFFARANMLQAYSYFLYLRPKKKIFSIINRNKVRWIKKYWFPLCQLLPKQNNKVVFTSTKSKPMGENFNWLMNELKKSGKLDGLQVYKFLGTTKSTKKLLFRYFHSATANTIFLEDYHNPYYGLEFSKKTNIVQLWHACGAFKKFAHDALDGTDSNTKVFEDNAHSFYSDVIVSSEQIGVNYSTAFQQPVSKIQSLGVPRTDLFFDLDKISKIKSHILKRYPYLSATKNILYSPTFRGGPAERKTFNLSIDWNKLKDMPRNYKFIIKLHPVVERISPEIPDWIKDRVLVLNAKENVNDWMLFCDVLITDYSSLIFEYSLLDKPIIYYPFDLKEYFNERGFYYSYDTYIYGEIAYTSNELVQAILNAEMKHESFYEAKDNFKKKFMGSCDGKASQRIIQYFLEKQG